jgi:hypothetical protein
MLAIAAASIAGNVWPYRAIACRKIFRAGSEPSS